MIERKQIQDECDERNAELFMQFSNSLADELDRQRKECLKNIVLYILAILSIIFIIYEVGYA